jgi:hypothetical protein
MVPGPTKYKLACNWQSIPPAFSLNSESRPRLPWLAGLAHPPGKPAENLEIG